MAAWKYDEFRGALEQEARFARSSAADLHRRILDPAPSAASRSISGR
jgi:hypothetical protein